MDDVKNVEDVVQAVARIRDGLTEAGEQSSADELSAALGTYYTTSTEWLIGLREALEKTRPAWSALVHQRILGERAIKDATRLMNLE